MPSFPELGNDFVRWWQGRDTWPRAKHHRRRSAPYGRHEICRTGARRHGRVPVALFQTRPLRSDVFDAVIRPATASRATRSEIVSLRSAMHRPLRKPRSSTSPRAAPSRAAAFRASAELFRQPALSTRRLMTPVVEGRHTRGTCADRGARVHAVGAASGDSVQGRRFGDLVIRFGEG